MGYNKSKRSVMRSKIQLDQLEEMRSTVRFPTNDPKALQNRLNEALAAAEVHEEFKHYFDNIRSFYRFEIETDYVIARYIDDLVTGDPIGVVEENGKSKSYSSSSEKELNISNAYSLIDVLGSLLANLDMIEINFPNVVLSEDEKLKLWGWTKESDHTEWLFIDMMDKGIVLTRKDGIPLEMLWTPESKVEEDDLFG